MKSNYEQLIERYHDEVKGVLEQYRLIFSNEASAEKAHAAIRLLEKIFSHSEQEIMQLKRLAQEAKDILSGKPDYKVKRKLSFDYSTHNYKQFKTDITNKLIDAFTISEVNEAKRKDEEEKKNENISLQQEQGENKKLKEALLLEKQNAERAMVESYDKQILLKSELGHRYFIAQPGINDDNLSTISVGSVLTTIADDAEDFPTDVEEYNLMKRFNGMLAYLEVNKSDKEYILYKAAFDLINRLSKKDYLSGEEEFNKPINRRHIQFQLLHYSVIALFAFQTISELKDKLDQLSKTPVFDEVHKAKLRVLLRDLEGVDTNPLYGLDMSKIYLMVVYNRKPNEIDEQVAALKDVPCNGARGAKMSFLALREIHKKLKQLWMPVVEDKNANASRSHIRSTVEDKNTNASRSHVRSSVSRRLFNSDEQIKNSASPAVSPVAVEPELGRTNIAQP